MTFADILELVRQSATEKQKGTKFEKLMNRFFQNDNRYKSILSDVWLWDEFPYKDDLGGRDLGIDLVAKTNEDSYWAIQCKCYAKDTVIDKKAVDSFIATSSRGFGEKGKLKFSNRIWVSSSNKWGANAEETLNNQNPPITRLTSADLDESSLDWNALWQGKSEIKHKTKKPMDHQKEAVQKALDYYQTNDRGKLIMACGTGKTYTSLLIAESMVKKDGFVLFMVPSIALLGQGLNSWMADTSRDLYPIGVCSDATASEIKKKADEDEIEDSLNDLSIPASTNVKTIVNHIKIARMQNRLPVIFSTYQSIDVVSAAQKAIFKETKDEFGVFDLIICDEAHRTTGVKYGNVDESDFVKIHDDKFIQGKKRLYMTATPRVYGEGAKTKAKEQDDCVLFSMDDKNIYGEEFYRVGFGYAVDKGLLTDYKVLVLSVNEYDLPKALLAELNKENKEFDFDDSSKMIGVISALSKLIQGDDGVTWNADPCVMKRAVAFCQKIGKANMACSSKNFEKVMPYISEQYEKEIEDKSKEHLVKIETHHVDGSMSASDRTRILDWLKEDTEPNICRIVSNVRCLSEGVDVPALDAVIFMSPRNSQVDVVQSVGRVMRTFKKGSPNEKKYGYIIIPVVIPLDTNANEALGDNKRFKVVWDILNALRSHDDRFNAEVNSVVLNKRTPPRIIPVKPGAKRKEISSGKHTVNGTEDFPFDPGQVEMRFHEFEAAFKARLVEKVGEKFYWENWAKDIGSIAKKFVARIDYLRNDVQNKKIKTLFEKYLTALHKNINNSVTEDDAVQMLAQHMITQPIFDALFDDYKFIDNNSISRTMTKVIKELRKEGVDQEVDELEKFYISVRTNVGQIDNLEGKQKVIKELYEKFFKSAFPTTVEKLGIVYTPIECVDFIIHSVNILLHEEFKTDLTNRDVHIMDPFTGTGTFVTRLLQSGLIKKEDMERKYKNELHANEIVLLAYYIADVNIESVYHYLNKSTEYLPFNGICLTDTFQTAEHKDGSSQESAILDDYFGDNYKEVEKQRKIPVRVIIGNPPYSVGQKSANDNAQNLSYPILDSRIEDSYAAKSTANLKKSLYDSYIKAFRWASDRIQKNKEGGIVAFITNGSWLDGNGQDGMRKCLVEEFTSIWVLNLRGNQRTSGELSRKEGGKIFGSGSRTPVTITFLVYNPEKVGKSCEIHYNDIGDYLTREDKLEKLKKASSIQAMKWETITPNEKADWINQRGNLFDTLTPLAPEKKFDTGTKSLFVTNAIGIATNRDSWVYSFSENILAKNMKSCVEFYNSQQELYRNAVKTGKNIEDILSRDSTKISWTVNLKKSIESDISLDFVQNIRKTTYRPFQKQFLYFEKAWIERPGLSPRLFPTPDTQNLVICVKGVGDKDFSCIITNSIPDLQVIFNGQCFPLYYYSEQNKSDLFSQELERKDGISDYALKEAKHIYGTGKKITKEAIFYYVYGFLHNRDYRETFNDDLKKSLPKIIFVSKYEDFVAFEQAGRELASLHLNYEKSTADVTKLAKKLGIKITGDKSADEADQNTLENFKYFHIPDKMRFASKTDKSKILYNANIAIENIPARAYDYIVNGKSAIDWIVERYAVTQDKASLITNDCNDWAKEHKNPRYILNTLLSVIDLSIKTMDIVDNLPKVDFGE